MQALPPRYVRKVSVHNRTHHALTLQVQFQQNQASHTVAADGHVDIEGVIDHGSWQACDPVTKITVIDAGNGNNIICEREFSSDSGVKILHFELTQADNHNIAWNEVHHNDQ